MVTFLGLTHCNVRQCKIAYWIQFTLSDHHQKTLWNWEKNYLKTFFRLSSRSALYNLTMQTK